jgi:hypothetical protein
MLPCRDIPFYFANLVILQAQYANMISQVCEAHLSDRKDKTVSADLMCYPFSLFIGYGITSKPSCKPFTEDLSGTNMPVKEQISHSDQS